MCWQLFDPGHVDGWVIGLLAIAFLPWLWQIIESVGFPGGSIKFRELQEKQERQHDEIQALQFLVAHFLTGAEQLHLGNLASGKPFELRSGMPNAFYDEMRRLRSLGFIAQKGEMGVRALAMGSGDVKDFFEIAEPGRQYLKLLDETQAWTRREPSV